MPTTITTAAKTDDDPRNYCRYCRQPLSIWRALVYQPASKPGAQPLWWAHYYCHVSAAAAAAEEATVPELRCAVCEAAVKPSEAAYHNGEPFHAVPCARPQLYHRLRG